MPRGQGQDKIASVPSKLNLASLEIDFDSLIESTPLVITERDKTFILDRRSQYIALAEARPLLLDLQKFDYMIKEWGGQDSLDWIKASPLPWFRSENLSSFNSLKDQIYLATLRSYKEGNTSSLNKLLKTWQAPMLRASREIKIIDELKTFDHAEVVTYKDKKFLFGSLAKANQELYEFGDHLEPILEYEELRSTHRDERDFSWTKGNLEFGWVSKLNADDLPKWDRTRVEALYNLLADPKAYQNILNSWLSISHYRTDPELSKPELSKNIEVHFESRPLNFYI